MQLFRIKCLRLALTLFTGIIFLNMGFFLLEVRVLELHNDARLMENISRMLAGAAFEEERDAGASSSSVNFAEEEYTLGHDRSDTGGSYFLIAEKVSHLLNDGTAKLGYLKRFSPPPEV